MLRAMTNRQKVMWKPPTNHQFLTVQTQFHFRSA
ncbi:MAG: hypothetical protein ACJAS1_006221, partial [Oleiphilaceae bacterium]